MKKTLLAIAIPILLLGLPGCTPAQSHNHEHHAQHLKQHDRCHMCGMMITKYPGPKGQLMLKDSDAVPKFCSSRDMFSFALQPENQRRIKAMFVHDMGTTDWEQPDDNAFIDATTAWYVYGTSKKGVMGPAVAPFSTKEAAQAFAEAWGGRVLAYEEITLELLEGAG
ncbi:nitrous oxide reductase accessory protein NosL [Shewanella algae]|uniref:nitrous oxide reductase accessory protein NosL n=1 Tax=Shewanella algae TaxID=38313 RepID=UPI001184104E|nr:nitrous oxide reductase accessory protein NosL [Shewanella algae]TVL38940.1 nitrous oxide reductase accessory protein NosL [Shewanella algae]